MKEKLKTLCTPGLDLLLIVACLVILLPLFFGAGRALIWQIREWWVCRQIDRNRQRRASGRMKGEK